jgi:hypothetical protein
MHVTVYRMSDIKKQEADGGLGLSLGSLVLIALLSGGDYNKVRGLFALVNLSLMYHREFLGVA